MTRLSPMGAEALRLATEFGFPVFPCATRSKTPLVRPLKADGAPWVKGVDAEASRVVRGGFHRASTHPDVIAEWWQQWPDANVATRLGSFMRLCLLEADTDDAGDYLDDCASRWPATWSFRASRGVNRLYHVPVHVTERHARNLWPEQFGAGVEFKNLGAGTLPPSVHHSGHVYAWVNGCAPGIIDLADLPGDVEDEVRRVDALRLLAESTEALERHRLPRVALVHTDSNERKAFRVQRYLEAIPSGLSDGRKHAAYVLAARLVTDLECSADETRVIVAEWNACNAPPLPLKILRDIIDNAIRYASRRVA